MTDKTKYKSVAIDNNCYKKIEELTTELTPGIKLSRAEVVRFLVNNFKFVDVVLNLPYGKFFASAKHVKIFKKGENALSFVYLIFL